MQTNLNYLLAYRTVAFHPIRHLLEVFQVMCLLALFPCNPTWRMFSVFFGILCQVFVLHKVVLNASVAHLAATQYVPSELHWGSTGKISPEPMLSGLFALNAQNILPHAGNKCYEAKRQCI